MSKSQRFTLSLHSGSDDPLALAMKRACDRCRRRKTRCDGQTQCRACVKAGIECQYLAQPKPLGRRPRKLKLMQRAPVDGGDQTNVPATDDHRAQGFQESHGPVPAREVMQPPLDMSGQTVQTGQTGQAVVTPEVVHSSPNSSTGYGQSAAHSSDESIHTIYPESLNNRYDQLREIPVDFDFTSSSVTDWNSYPSLNLYAPTLEGSLPVTNGLETLNPGEGQDFFAENTFANTGGADAFSVLDKAAPPSLDWTVSTLTFVPYVKLFFERLYPVFPVLERQGLPTEETHTNPIFRSWENYALLTSLAGAVTIQLNLTAPQPSTAWDDASNPDKPPGEAYTPDFWVAQATEARKQWDFAGGPNEATIMTSFFIFEYYGHKNQSQRAWYHLREAIGFALAIGLDDPDTYLDLEPRIAQRRCRMFWLLFITERAYALQHKSSAMLRSTIELPRIFESDSPKLIFGFVSLVNLFKAVDDKFLSLWKGGDKANSLPAPSSSSSSSADGKGQSWQRMFHAALADQSGGGGSEIVEVQRLDILVTQQWLHLLAWQMQMRKGAKNTSGREFPFAISRDTLSIISKANRKSLEAHGIGMEQKIFDIACCLSDVLETPSARLDPEAISMGHQYLHGFMTMLSSFRNQESQYLRPLLTRASLTLAAELQVPSAWMARRQRQQRAGELVGGWLEDVEAHGEDGIMGS